jgi:pimeloyl-ACP methyl ester carboxylesterase
MIERVVANGFSAVAFEMPGHGGSSGTAPTLFDFSGAILAISRIYGSFSAVVGHSIGGLAVIMAAKEQPIAKRLVLVSPLARAQGGLTTFARLTGISLSVLHRMQKNIEDHYGVLFSECEIEHLASEISVPMLAIHDREDRMSPCEPVEAWATMHPDVRFVETAGLGHQRILVSEPVIEEFSVFLGAPKVALRLDGLTEYAL